VEIVLKSSIKQANKFVGHGGPILYKVLYGDADKPTGISMAINYELAPVPSHYYVADFYQVFPRELDILMIFGKIDHPKSERLRNKIEIIFPVHQFIYQLWKGSRDFEKTINAFLDQHHIPLVRPGTIPAETDKVQTLYSNNVLMVQAAGQCISDFFYISEKDLWLKPPKSEQVPLEAIVRVMMQSPTMAGFLQACDDVAAHFIKKLGLEIQENDNETLELQQF
jgi:hypothetical protein